MDAILMALAMSLGATTSWAVSDAAKDQRPVVVEQSLDAPQIAAQSLVSPHDGAAIECVIVNGGAWTCSPPR